MKIETMADLRRKITALSAVSIRVLEVLEDAEAGIISAASDQNKVDFVNAVLDQSLIAFADYWEVGGNEKN